MEEDLHEYRGDDVDVTFDSNRCIHARECVEGLPAVFDTSRRPWIDPDRADADEVAAVVERCPTGALQYDRRDGGENETPPETNTVTPIPNGPLYIAGDIEIRTQSGETLLRDTRVGLCRCGHSGNLPLCDNSHLRVFEADGHSPENATEPTSESGDVAEGDFDASELQLTVTLNQNGPFSFDGPFVLRTSGDAEENTDGAAFCRCGASAAKPFCDGSHTAAGFSTGPEE